MAENMEEWYKLLQETVDDSEKRIQANRDIIESTEITDELKKAKLVKDNKNIEESMRPHKYYLQFKDNPTIVGE